MKISETICRVLIVAATAAAPLIALPPMTGCVSAGQADPSDPLSLEQRYAEATIAVDLFRDRLIAARPLIPRSKWADIRAIDDAMHSALVGLGVAAELGQASRAQTNLDALDAILADAEALLTEYQP